MNVDARLEKIISDSYKGACERHNEFFTPEHLLRTAMEQHSVLELLLGCGADVHAIIADLDDYLTTNIPVYADDGKDGRSAEPTVGLQSVMERAGEHCASADKKTIETEDVLATCKD